MASTEHSGDAPHPGFAAALPSPWLRRMLWLSLALNAALLAVVGYYVQMHGGVGGLWNQIATKPPPPLRWDPHAFEHFKAFPHEPHATVFLGDSITAEAPFAEYFANLRSRGLGGDTTGLILSRLDEAIQNSPDRVFINIGTNDLSKDVTPAELLLNYRQLLERVKIASPDARIYVISILPINLQFNDNPKLRQKQRQIVEVNKELVKLAQSMGASYIDAYTPLAGGTGSLPSPLTWDGLHLTWPGYRIYCQAIRESVDQQERRGKAPGK